MTPVYEIILVVDDSTAQTWSVASELALRHAGVRAIRMARNYGQQAAIVAGVRASRYDVIVTMDDDLQHPPEEVPGLVAALTDDLDLVYGIPEHEEHSFLRSLASRTVKAGIARGLHVPSARDISAFRAFRSFVQQGFDAINGPHVSVDVALSWATTRVGTVRVRMDRRAQGKSGYTVRALVRHAGNTVLGYSTAPLRLVTYLGLLVGLAGFALLARLLWDYFRGHTTVAGFTTVASIVTIFASCQMIAIGVLGEYVARIHAHGMGRPTYVIRQQVDGPGRARDEAAPEARTPRSPVPPR
jgi:glycosyltransferase involved in cell wall biosynthesis